MSSHPAARDGGEVLHTPALARNWWLFLVVGLVSIGAGVLAIVYPDITLFVLGMIAQMGLGIIDAILDILILSLPELSLVTLAVLFAISLLVRGAFMIAIAFKLRGARHHVDPGATVPA